MAYVQHMRGQCVMHHFQDERSKVKVTWVVSSFGPVRSVPLSLFDWITSYLAYINTWGDDVLRIIFRMTCQGHTGHLKFWPCPLHGFISIWLKITSYVLHTYNTWGNDVSHTIFRRKGQRSRSYGLFEVFTLSTPWLPPHCLGKSSV